MRTVSNEVENAITIPSDYKLGTHLTVYNSRIYFDAEPETIYSRESIGDITDIAAIPLEDSVSGNPYNCAIGLVNRNGEEIEDSSIVQWSVGATLDHPGANLLLNGVYVPDITPDIKSRIGCWNNNNNYNECSLWYYGMDGWKRCVATVESTETSRIGVTSISETTTLAGLGRGACYPVSYTEAVILDIYEGAVRVTFLDGSGNLHSSKHKFINPLKVLGDVSEDDIYVTHYGGAVKLNNVVYVYFTDYQGAVRSMQFTLSDDNISGTWSDIFTSIPQDQSQFDIGNVFAIGNRIFICGKFYREEQFASTTAYTLLAWSDDGITFTVNRRTLTTMRNLRWQVVYDSDDSKMERYQVYFVSPGLYYRTSAPYQMIGEQTNYVDVDLVSLSGNSTGEFQVTAVSGAEEYFGNSVIDTGSYAKLRLSQLTVNGAEYIKYHDVVITGVTKGIQNGARKYGIFLQLDGTWHTGNMTHPFYMEFQGKQSVYDNFIDQSNMVHASVGTNPKWALSVAFWTSDNKAFIFQSHPADTTTDHMTTDLLSYFTEYPKFGSVETYPTYEIKLFGWSRAGIAQSDPNGDGTNHSTLNDDVYALYEVVNPDTGSKEVRVSLITELSSPCSNFPQSYYNGRSGSFPVSFAIPNPGEGWEISRLGMRFISGSLGATTYCVERIEMPKIICEPLLGFTSNSDAVSYGTDGTGGKITNTKKAVPQILFSNRPYSAFNFSETLRTEIKGKYSMVGLIGLANDKYNFIVAYIKIGKIFLSTYREGKETVITSLSDTSLVENTRFDLRFWHRDGSFGFEYKLAATLEWPAYGSQLLYEWKSTDGVLASNDDIYHVGTYSFIDPPRFRITGFTSKQSVVGALPLDLDPATDTSDLLTDFLESGKIDIDDTVYNYSGKITKLKSDDVRGPFQLRNIGDWESKYAQSVDGGVSYQGGWAIEFLLFDWTASKTKYSGAIIACNSGNAWVNDETQWIPWITTAGVAIILRNRSRHYSDTMPEWWASADERVYITNGLTGLSPEMVTEEEFTHAEGAWAFKHEDDQVIMYRYSAVSGEEDQTIRHLLDVFNRIAGTHAVFPGDFDIESSTTSEQVALQ